ncbi:hypothetical protein IQ273_03855 [Nodosilinea sp. LEGE 07298]|uniref:hypothetical protein n=1 Tax=Nodosilinea sp. LEGE 07298 TaxID=2777970 RepID=UPI001881C973|nr:hypothetical protein [Nodosilinea sp. LEGE 07298]MBE9108551.1 hypothetical protein [Nodosilinea sp. LEGE 07298]
MTEENRSSENSEVVRKLVTPDSTKSAEESGDRSPTKTERNISNESQEMAKTPNPRQSDKVRSLAIPTTDEDLKSLDNDRSTTKKD